MNFWYRYAYHWKLKQSQFWGVELVPIFSRERVNISTSTAVPTLVSQHHHFQWLANFPAISSFCGPSPFPADFPLMVLYCMHPLLLFLPCSFPHSKMFTPLTFIRSPHPQLLFPELLQTDPTVPVTDPLSSAVPSLWFYKGLFLLVYTIPRPLPCESHGPITRGLFSWTFSFSRAESVQAGCSCPPSLNSVFRYWSENRSPKVELNGFVWLQSLQGYWNCIKDYKKVREAD